MGDSWWGGSSDPKQKTKRKGESYDEALWKNYWVTKSFAMQTWRRLWMTERKKKQQFEVWWVGGGGVPLWSCFLSTHRAWTTPFLHGDVTSAPREAFIFPAWCAAACVSLSSRMLLRPGHRSPLLEQKPTGFPLQSAECLFDGQHTCLQIRDGFVKTSEQMSERFNKQSSREGESRSVDVWAFKGLSFLSLENELMRPDHHR